MKQLSLFLIFALILSFTACGSGNQSGTPNDTSNNTTSTDTPQNNSNNGNTICYHDWIDATCTSAKKCTKCNEESGKALGHTTDSGICSRCNENLTSWEVGEYVDEFKIPTGEKYMLVDSTGVFSNSATTNSTLNACLQIDADNIGIMLWEYGRNLVKGTFDYEDYSITILDENDTKHYFTGTIYKSGTRVYFKASDRATVLNLLRNNDSLKIYLKSTKYSISTYLFTIDTRGFSSIYNTII